MKDRKFYIICQNVRSLFNVGSIFRTADCFGVDKIYLTGITGRPPRLEISKVALGADNFISWEYHLQPLRLIKKLQAEGIKVVALEQSQGSLPLQNFKPIFPLALIIGEEVKGLPRSILKVVNQIVEIPMHGKKESLNVGIACGIAADHISRFKYLK